MRLAPLALKVLLTNSQKVWRSWEQQPGVRAQLTAAFDRSALHPRRACRQSYWTRRKDTAAVSTLPRSLLNCRLRTDFIAAAVRSAACQSLLWDSAVREVRHELLHRVGAKFHYTSPKLPRDKSRRPVPDLSRSTLRQVRAMGFGRWTWTVVQSTTNSYIR